ncbi:MAG TPA: type II secretion system protein [Terriglobales bacterium]|jgi:type II secretory pathway pseudopilin PulG
MAMTRTEFPQNGSNASVREVGFSAIEMLLTLALLTIVLGVVVKGIIELQARNFNETGKVDAVQETRDFIDQMARDIHGSGYPPPAVTTQITNAGCNDATIRANVNVACGIVSFSTTSVQYEADLDGSGTVSVVYLSLVPPTGSTNCPCILQRGTVTKAQANAGTAPAYFTTVNGILNSGDGTGNNGSGAPTYSLSMSGPGSYASYANADVFNAYDSGADLITTACNWTTAPNCSQIRSLQITANVAPPYYDVTTKVFPVYSITSRARINF